MRICLLFFLLLTLAGCSQVFLIEGTVYYLESLPRGAGPYMYFDNRAPIEWEQNKLESAQVAFFPDFDYAAYDSSAVMPHFKEVMTDSSGFFKLSVSYSEIGEMSALQVTKQGFRSALREFKLDKQKDGKLYIKVFMEPYL